MPSLRPARAVRRYRGCHSAVALAAPLGMAGSSGARRSATERTGDPTMPAMTPEEGAVEARIHELQERDHIAYEHLRRNARAVYRAVEGWSGVKSPDEWETVCSESNRAYRSGHFLIERLGAERFLEPTLMATLWGLRQSLLCELGKATAAEIMLVDMAVLTYYNALRVQGW